MKTKTTFIIFILLSNLLTADTLYSSKDYTILKDKVFQNNFSAEVISPYNITSNYKSNFRTKTKSTVTFKFSINGSDNERKPGQDHVINIYSKNGKVEAPLINFGENSDVNLSSNETPVYIDTITEVTFKVDMSKVFNDFNSKGYYETFDGRKIYKDDFDAVYIAGGIEPLNWDFTSLKKSNKFKLTDNDSNKIYEIKITFLPEYSPEKNYNEVNEWKLNKDISRFPSLSSNIPLIEAMYNLSIEEMLLDIREDGAFMAGAKWFGVWTRDISYSILLSLAIVNPDASKVSLMAKVKNGIIIQDTGTGGAWPISSDRMTWALAAYEIYLVTGDKDWLKQSYTIIKNSVKADEFVLKDNETDLYRGESSFLDWREQSYPQWMEPVDIYTSLNLGTNSVHFRTYVILAEMAKNLGEDYTEYIKESEKIKNAINKYLWISESGYYGQYLYGKHFLTKSENYETLGESLSILFDIADKEMSKKIISKTPNLNFGTPTFYPQIPKIPPYHNNSVWPFVQAFWNLAAAKTKNHEAVKFGISSIYRAASLFLTNKENIVAETGDYLGTEINSNRQLWSVAGNLSVIYKILFGMNFENNSIRFSPFIPEHFNEKITLNNFTYRDSKLDIEIEGFGDSIKEFKIDGKKSSNFIFPDSLTGSHTIKIIMNHDFENFKSIKIVKNKFMPEIPNVKLKENKLQWDKINDVKSFNIYAKGNKISTTKDTFFVISNLNKFMSFQISSVDKNNLESYLSNPIEFIPENSKRIVEAESNYDFICDHKGFSGKGYVINDKSDELIYNINIVEAGFYLIDFKYANGNGPINTDNKCAIRTLELNTNENFPLIFPQRGDGDWDNWGYSNPIKVKLNKGLNKLRIYFTDLNNNMNFEINNFNLDHIRIIKN